MQLGRCSIFLSGFQDIYERRKPLTSDSTEWEVY